MKIKMTGKIDELGLSNPCPEKDKQDKDPERKWDQDREKWHSMFSRFVH